MSIFLKIALGCVCIYLAGSAVLLLSGLSEDVFPAEVAVVLGNEVYADGSCAPRTAARAVL